MTRDDFRKAFGSSYFGVHPSALTSHSKNAAILASKPFPLDCRWVPCIAPDFPSDSDMTIHALLGPTGDRVRMYLKWIDDLDEKEYVDIRAPKVGLVQLPDSYVYVTRHAKRQFSRGYVPGTMGVLYPNPTLMVAVGKNTTPTDYSLVWGVFNPKQMHPQQARDLLEHGQYAGVALSKYIGLCLEKSRKFICITYKDTIVGYLKGNDAFVYETLPDVPLEYVRKILPWQVSVLSCN